MGFFNLDDHAGTPQAKELKGFSLATLHAQGCKVCPLATQTGLHNPQMDPFGTRKPLVYMLGEAPSIDDDRRGKHFGGEAGKLLRRRIPHAWLKDMRWNYVVRTHPKQRKEGKKEPPHPIAVEACRASIVKDIEETKPFAIFGFGAGPLKWALDETGIAKWAGRFVPVTIGKHTCWYFPFLDPQEVLEKRRYEPRSASEFGCDEEFQLHLNMRRAFELVDTLPDPVVHTEEMARANVEFVTGHERGDLDKVLDFLDRCYDADDFGFDYETNMLRPYGNNARVLTVALALEDKAFSFPLDHPKAGWSKADLRILEKEWAAFLHNVKAKRLVHNAVFEQEWSAHMWGRKVVQRGRWECTQSQAYILDERPWTSSLDFLCALHFGLRLKELHKVDKKDMESVPLETCLKYNAVDAKYHRLLYHVQRKLLKQQDLTRVYNEHMLRVSAVALTQLHGVPIDSEQVEEFYNKLQGEIKELEQKILEYPAVCAWEKRTAQDFHPGNNNHVMAVLKDLGFNELEKTKDDALDKLDHPFAEMIRAYRKPTKLLSTYIIPVRKGSAHLFPDGYLHPIIVTTKTRTWRTSSEDPNIQNWPKRGAKIYIRKLVKPIGGTEKVIVAIDYGGMQARNVAMESLDPELIKVYWDHYDIHTDWLERLLRLVPNWKPVEKLGVEKHETAKLRKAYRETAKNKFVFPCFFGAHETSLARYLGIPVNKAGELRAEFFDKFKTVEKWHERQRAFYKKHGYITGHTGFRRRAPIELNQLINAPIQADESFIVCRAWHELTMLDDRAFTPTWMIHDDLTFVWEKREVEKRLETVAPIMVKWSEPWMKSVPFEIDVSIGATWDALKGIGGFETTKDGGCREVKK